MTPEPPSGLDWLRAFDAEVQRAIWLPDAGRWLLCAHAAYESGWGTSKAFRHGLNFGNITAGPHWHGQVYEDTDGDTAYDAQGKYLGRITQVWRCYPTVGAAIEDYWVTLGWPRYIAARDALERGELGPFCHYLGPSAPRGMGGYYTLPEKQYAAGLGSVLQRVTSVLRPPDPATTPPLNAA